MKPQNSTKLLLGVTPFVWLFSLFATVSSSAQVIFSDDFERASLGPAWTSEAYASWSILNGKAYNSIEGSGGKLATTQYFDEANYALETVAYPFEYGYWREYYLTFGEQDEPDASYAIRYDAAYGGTLQIVKGTDNIYFPEVLASVKTKLNDTDPLKLRVEHTADGTISLFVSEAGAAFPATPLLQTQDSSYPTLGKIGWHISTQTAAQDFFVERIEATVLPTPLIFEDDFDRAALGPFWGSSPGWSIQSGQAYNAPNDNGLLLTTASRFGQSSYVLETEATPFVTGYYRNYFLMFGQPDPTANEGYVITYDAYLGGVLSLGAIDGNYYFPTVLDDQVLRLDPAKSYTLKIEKYDNGLIQVYVGDDDGFPAVPTLEAIDNTHPTLGHVSWACATQTAGEDFFVEYIRARVPETQKTTPEKPAEDALIKQVLVQSERAYEVGKLNPGSTFFTDRAYTLTDVPTFLEGASFVKTANDDKRLTTSGDFLRVYLKQPAIAYVGYDPRGTQLPAWLSDWTKTEEVMGTTDPGSPYYEVYTRRVGTSFFEVYRHQLILGANRAAPAVGADMNYIVAFVPVDEMVRYEAEDATLSGVQAASKHAGFSGSGYADYINKNNDYVDWSISVPGTSPYQLSVRYANGGTTERNLQVSLDGQVIDTLRGYSQTGQWDTWRSESIAPVLIEAGEHEVRLTALGNSGPNVDYLQVSPSDALLASARTVQGLSSQSSSEPAVGMDAPFVQLYPNPMVNHLEFRVNRPLVPSLGQLRIIDLQGREVYVRQWENTTADAPKGLRLDVSSWNAGTYLYQVTTGQQVIHGKLLKTD